jgi:hypothetical protein
VQFQDPDRLNACTIAVSLSDLWEPLSARGAFIASWSQVREALLRLPGPGFLVAIFHPEHGLVTGALPLMPGRSSHRVLGRHTDVHLRLPHDPAISLRHLLLSAWLRQDGKPSVRALDLGTSLEPKLEDGRQVAGLVADGSCFASIGDWSLQLLLADREQWPTDPDEAWQCLGEREVADVRSPVHGDDLAHRIRPRLRVVDEEPDHGCSTIIRRLASPSLIDDLPEDCPDAVGFLTLPGGRFVRLSPAALHRGVLVGRYARCAIGPELFGDDRTVSRVHLCLVADPTGAWVVDLGSSNGTRIRERRVRALRLGAPLRLRVGHSTVRWRPHRDGETGPMLDGPGPRM